MFKRKKKKTGCETPEFRKPTTPPPPSTSGSNAVKPGLFLSPLKANLCTILPNDVGTVEIMCQYETPCGWCTKWDKKCDKKIGCENTDNSKGEFATKHLGIWVKSDNPCLECVHYGWSMPQCRECKPPHNNYKYFKRKME